MRKILLNLICCSKQPSVTLPQGQTNTLAQNITFTHPEKVPYSKNITMVLSPSVGYQEFTDEIMKLEALHPLDYYTS